MLKGFLKYFLSISILLLSGYSQLFGHSAVHTKHTQAGIISQNTYPLCARTAAINGEGLNHRFHVSVFESEEDNDLNSFKKFLEVASYPLSPFYVQPPGCFINTGKRDFSFLSSAPSGRYLLLQVFRI